MSRLPVYPCKFCGKTLATSSGLSRHQQLARECRSKLDDLVASFNGITVFDVDDTGVNDGIDMVTENERTNVDILSEERDDQAQRTESPLLEHGGADIDWDQVRSVIDDKDSRFVEAFPEDHQAGVPISAVMKETDFEVLARQGNLEGRPPWFPYASKGEWEMAEWLVNKVGQNSIEEFLQLSIVSTTSSMNECRPTS
jgi:hypothetical protein